MTSLLSHSFYSVLYGLFLLLAAIGAVAHYSLLNNLKRHDRSQWVALGSPEMFKITQRQFTGANGIRDEWGFQWYLISMKYRRSEIQMIRIAGHTEFGCAVGMWLIAIYLLALGG